MKKINYEKAKGLNITPRFWFVFFKDAQDKVDFLNFLQKKDYVISRSVYDPKYYDFLVKVPIDKSEDLVCASGGGLSVWGGAMEACNLMYKAKEFIHDYLEDEKLAQQKNEKKICDSKN